VSSTALLQEFARPDVESLRRRPRPVVHRVNPSRVPAWEDIARDHGQFLYAVAYRLAGDEHDAQDLVQDALLRVRGGLERYEPGSLKAWLARIVTNLFLDEMRRRKRRPQAALPNEHDTMLPCSPGADDVSDGLSDEVQRALQAIPAEYRVPVVLCAIDDFSYAQIAAATGLPLGTVRSRIHRGRRLLRTALAPSAG
jgi:RNA polymerase sigma-70 factor, ECF subfamily